jgi:hypothetical protein
MRGAIDLDDELELSAGKVGKIFANGFLPYELKPAKLTVAKVPP